MHQYIKSLYDPEIDGRFLKEHAKILKTTPLFYPPKLAAPAPQKVDLSQYLHFIRRQGGAGCWGYSTLAVWDIMNEMACPYTPNLSMRLWMMLHRRRELWEKQKGISSPDGRFHAMSNPEWGFLQSFGNTTEGNEPTFHQHGSLWPDGGWSVEGINEAGNYRLASEPIQIPVSSEAFVNSLSNGSPIRLLIVYHQGGKAYGHYVAVVGYDSVAETFKYVNSVGDKWGKNGSATFTFDEVDKKKAGTTDITGAEIFKIYQPKPVPAARISVKHSNRANIHLWLSAENSPHPRKKIWPQGWDENSRNLCYTVRLPSEFIWPPSKKNRLVLALYDSGEFSKTGGTLEEFSAVFGKKLYQCGELSSGSVGFVNRERREYTIP